MRYTKKDIQIFLYLFEFNSSLKRFGCNFCCIHVHACIFFNNKVRKLDCLIGKNRMHMSGYEFFKIMKIES